MALALDSLEILEACDEACELLTVSLEAFSDPGAVHVRPLDAARLICGTLFFLSPFSARQFSHEK